MPAPKLTAIFLFVVIAAPLPAARSRADMPPDAGRQGDIDVAVSVDPTAQAGRAEATVKIHAERRIVWSLLTNCASASKLVPGLTECAVLETAPDRSWQLIRHVIDYSWYVPRLDLTFRAVYRYPERISMSRVSGDLKVFESAWDLEDDGAFTIVHFSLALAPGFWVPRWLVRVALRHDLPRTLRALRALAESSRSNPAAAAGQGERL